MTAAHVADTCGISRVFYSQIENGYERGADETRQKIDAYLAIMQKAHEFSATALAEIDARRRERRKAA